MKTVYTLLLTLFVATGLFAGGNPPADSLTTLPAAGAEPTRALPMVLFAGISLEAEGTRLTIRELDDTYGGSGELYFPALDETFPATFRDLEVNAFGEVLRGTIRARTQVQGGDLGAGEDPQTPTAPLDITPHLRARPNFQLPEGARMLLDGVTVTSAGTFVGLDFDTPTLVEDDALFFTGREVAVDPLTFCLDGVELPIVSGGGLIDDFEFPMRILAGDPNEESEGSYVVFNCDGFQEFNLSAEYPFPRDQVVPAANARDTVFARFRINATGLSNFVAFATVTPFEIAGVDDMVFTIDSAYVDYSDEANPAGFDWDPVAGAEPELGWKGLFLRRLQLTLPESVGALNGGEELIIGGENIVYSRGNGMSGDLFAYNLLDLSEGGLDGWGFSIDTLETLLVQNSIGDFNFRGDVFIPVFGEGDEIAYGAFLGSDDNGSPSLTIALDVAGTYTVPFLGDVAMTLTEDSKAGVRFGNSGPEPYLSASGSLDIRLGGEMAGVTIPEVNLPGITFQDFKLNDAELAATQAANVATAGMDRMSFGSFQWAGVDLGAVATSIGDAMNAAEAASNPTAAVVGDDEKKVNGKKVSIEDIKFTTVEVGGEELKRLRLNMILNLTKGSGGISGELQLGVRGKVDYAKLVSVTPWKALSYHSLEVGDVEVEARYGNVSFGGALSIYDADETYGKGFKGGLMVAMDLGATEREFAAMGQFGTVEQDGEEFDYFFVDFRTSFRPGISMGALEMTGLGGGLYYNMTKNITTRATSFGERNPRVNSTPGESFSGTTYTPRVGSIGLAAATTIGLARKHDVFTADAELTFEFGEESGLRRILFDGKGYILSKDEDSKKQATIKANIAVELNFERGFLGAQFAYEVRAPYSNPILTGGSLSGPAQGALMIDINPDDENEYDNYFYFGKPRRPADLRLGIGGISVGVDAYVMMGTNLPNMVPLREIHPAFSGFPDVSRNQGSSFGYAFGVKLASSGKAKAGPLSLEWDVVAGADASIRRYSNVTCSNTGREIGMNGWYVKGRAYLHVHAAMKLHVKINLGLTSINKKVSVASLSATAALVAELPNPTYVGGKIKVRASALGFSVTKSVSIEIGEKCVSSDLDDPAAAVASIKVIEDTWPRENEDEPFDIFGEPIAAFGYPLTTTATVPVEETDMIIVPGEEEGEGPTIYFPYLKDMYIQENGVGRVACDLIWSDENRVAKLAPEEVLTDEADHTLVVRVRWRIKEPNKGWRDLTNKRGEYVDEVKSIPFRTGPFPKVMATNMLDPDRHLPGNGQRNWHVDFGNGEIYFRKPGMDRMFAQTFTRKIEGYEPRTMAVKYAIRLTDMETGEARRIPITERPGSFSLEEFRNKKHSVQIATSSGNRTVNYTKKALVSYNSKGIKFNGINDLDFFQKGKMYRFEILRVPDEEQENDGDANITTTEAISEVPNSDGVVFRRTSVSIGEQTADPYKLPDIVYSFAFRVSNYDNLAEKVSAMRLANTGFATLGKKEIDHPRQTKRSSGDIYAPEVIDRSAAVRDKYYLFRVDEGFDWWDIQRLKVNLRVDENIVDSYYSTQAGQDIMEIAQITARDNGTGYMWEAALEYDHITDHNGVWYELVWPRVSGEQEPKLTTSEIESGTAGSTVVLQGTTSDNGYSYSGKWDVGVRYKGKRVIKMQTDAAWILSSFFAQLSQEAKFLGQRQKVFTWMKNHGSTARGMDGYNLYSNEWRTSWYLNPTGGPNAPKGVASYFGGTGVIFLLDNYDWSNSHRWNFSLPTQEQVDRLDEIFANFNPTPQDFRQYTAPLRYHYRDTYDQLYDKVAAGQTIDKNLPNAFE